MAWINEPAPQAICSTAVEGVGAAGSLAVGWRVSPHPTSNSVRATVGLFMETSVGRSCGWEPRPLPVHDLRTGRERHSRGVPPPRAWFDYGSLCVTTAWTRLSIIFLPKRSLLRATNLRLLTRPTVLIVPLTSHGTVASLNSPESTAGIRLDSEGGLFRVPPPTPPTPPPG